MPIKCRVCHTNSGKLVNNADPQSHLMPDFYNVVCTNCGIEGPNRNSQLEALRSWQRMNINFK